MLYILCDVACTQPRCELHYSNSDKVEYVQTTPAIGHAARHLIIWATLYLIEELYYRNALCAQADPELACTFFEDHRSSTDR